METKSGRSVYFLSLLVTALVAGTVVTAGLAAPSARAGGDGDMPQRVTMAPDQVFAPTGFDNNDVVQIVVYTTLPNSCYKAGPIETKVDHKKKRIFVDVQAYYYGTGWCADVQSSYPRVVELGEILQAGKYRIYYRNQDKRSYVYSASLPISIAKSRQADEYLYAQVDEVFLKNRNTEVEPELVIRGQFPKSCMELQELRVIHNLPNVLEILPISKEQTGPCDSTPKPFESTISLGAFGLQKQGRVLFHVRSLNGSAVNYVAEF